jgi:olefin beta-lactone synthetase
LNPNIAARLAERAERHPERAAIVEARGGRAGRITFGELARRVARTGAGLRAAGLGVGSRALLFIPMSVDLYVGLLGVLHTGATAVFVDAWADRRRLDAAVEAARPDLFVGTPKAHLLRLLSRSVRRIPRHWVAGRRLLPLARHEREASAPPARVGGGTPALVTFTTGSTGTPKAAARSHDFLWAQHLALAEHLRLRPDDVDMPTLPVFVLNDLALGVTSVIPDFDPRRPAEIRPDRILRQMARERVTTSSGSPAFYERLLEGVRAEPGALDLRLWTGGAPVYPPLARALHRATGGRAHVVYGSTEAEPIAGIGAGEMLEAMSPADPRGGLCAGRPVPGIDLRLIRPTPDPVRLGPQGWGEWEVGPGETGEIVVAGAHVLGEYLDAPEETRRQKIRDGERVWHRTGDAGRLDADGRLWLMGRVGSRVLRGGESWWSTAAEVRALAVPGVRHAAYLGVPEGSGGQRAVLCVELDGGEVPAHELRAALAPFPIDEVRALARIPRDPRHSSKTDVGALRHLLAGAGPRGA